MRLPNRSEALAFLVLLAGSARLEAAPLSVQVTAAGAAQADAVVYALAADAGPTRSARAEITQVDREFQPRVIVVQTGTSVSFPNRDKVRHHVYSFSAAKRFELKLYLGMDAPPVTFDRAGVVTLGCNIHDWMVGYIVVVDTPYFAVTDAAGRATLDVPPGAYELRVWHAGAISVNDVSASQRITVAPSGGRQSVTLRPNPAHQPPRRPAG
jgi:plastocyanin